MVVAVKVFGQPVSFGRQLSLPLTLKKTPSSPAANLKKTSLSLTREEECRGEPGVVRVSLANKNLVSAGFGAAVPKVNAPARGRARAGGETPVGKAEIPSFSSHSSPYPALSKLPPWHRAAFAHWFRASRGAPAGVYVEGGTWLRGLVDT